MTGAIQFIHFGARTRQTALHLGIVQCLLKLRVDALEVEGHLAHLRVVELLGRAHPRERRQPLGDARLPLEVGREVAEAVEAVREVLDVGVELVHALDAEAQLVHDGDEERHRLGDGLALVALVVLYGDGPLLADPLERGGAVEPVQGWSIWSDNGLG